MAARLITDNTIRVEFDDSSTNSFGCN